jgi:hypothetical protein
MKIDFTVRGDNLSELNLVQEKLEKIMKDSFPNFYCFPVTYTGTKDSWGICSIFEVNKFREASVVIATFLVSLEESITGAQIESFKDLEKAEIKDEKPESSESRKIKNKKGKKEQRFY